MRRALLAVDGVALVLSVLYFAGGLGYPRGTLDQPGPGLYPLFVGLLLVAASLGSLVTDYLRPAEGVLELPRGRDLGRVLTVLGGSAGYVVLLPYAGHLLSSLVTVFVVLQAMGLRSWGMKISWTAVMAVGSYYLFDVLLKVPLPRGFLG